MAIPGAVQETMQLLKKEKAQPETAAKPTIGSILREHLPWIMNSGKFNEAQKQAAGLISVCKTPKLGTYVDYCPNCQKVVSVRYRSCNNRNCPGCQFPLQQKWIELRKSEVVEGTPQFHIVLTLPHELNSLIQANMKPLLSTLFRSSAQAVIEMCEDPQYLGAKPGIVSVLHTWTQDLQLHYHVHMICTAGGITPNGEYISLRKMFREEDQTLESGNPVSASVVLSGSDDDFDEDELPPKDVSDADDKGFFLPLKAITSLFRGKYMAALKALYDSRKLTFPNDLDYLNDPYEWAGFCHRLYRTKWVGYIAKTFNGAGNAIDYLARYTFRTAISNSRIFGYDGKQVSILVRDNDHPKQRKLVSLQVHDFIRRYLSHILPNGFTRVRFYGFLANGQKKKNLERIFQQLKNKPYEPSQLKNLTGTKLLSQLFPNKKIGCCPICDAALETYLHDGPFSPEKMIATAASRASPAA